MASLPAAYFDALYRADPAGWRVAPDQATRLKLQATLAALPRPQYRHGLEVGCGTGLLTEHLALRCNQLLGIDLAEAALAQASTRLQGVRNVCFAARAFPGELQSHAPIDGFDLIVMAEVLHCLDAQALARAARVTRSLVARGGHLLLVNGFGLLADCPLAGNEAAEMFIDALRPVAPMLLQVRTEDYRIDVLQL